MIALATKPEESETASWQDGFIEMLPVIEKHARMAFRGLDPEAREDAVTEVVANACCAYRRLHERGELQRAFASALAKYAVVQFRDGRRVGTSQASHDVLSRQSRKSNNYQVFSLGTNDPDCDELLDSLIDKRRTSVPDQAAFRVDFPRWFAGQSNRDRQIINRLSQSCTTSEVASEFQISAGRVSQLRREFADSWEEFHASTRKGTEIHHKLNFQPHNMKELCNA